MSLWKFERTPQRRRMLAGLEVDRKVSELRFKTPHLSYAQALDLVLSRDSELKAGYINGKSRFVK